MIANLQVCDLQGPELGFEKEMTQAVNSKCLACIFQELLDEEKAEMEENQMRERSTRSFNFGAYHSLETVGLHSKMPFIYPSGNQLQMFLL